MKAQAGETMLGIVAKASPPVTVLAGAASGIDWQMWVWVATFFYVALQFGLLLWDRIIKPLQRKTPQP